MAKGKHSTALFEVINSARESGRATQRLDTPKWWFKSRHRSGKTTAESQSTSRLAALHSNESDVETRRPDSRTADKHARTESEREPRTSAVRVGFDRAKKEFALRFRYTTALMCGFGLVVAVGVAYVAGRHMTSGPQTAAADVPVVGSTLQPARPAVLNVTKPRNTVVAAAPLTVDAPKHTPLTNANNVPVKTVVSSLVPASANTELPRIIKLNYVVIATYPIEEQVKADAARAYFSKAGIPCSLERCGWAPKMISLVGTAGFVKVHDKDFAGYLDNIVKIARTMKTSQFDRPSPGAYNWKGEPTDRTFAAN